MKGLLIDANGFIEAVDFPEKGKLDWYYRNLGCDYIDIVRPYGLDDVAKTYGLKAIEGKFCLVVDDEALLKDEPKVNPIASLLYGVDLHGQPICGKVLVGKNELTDEGMDTVGLTDAELMLLHASINSLIELHNEKVDKTKRGAVDG